MGICARYHSAAQLLEREKIIYLDLLSGTCLHALQTLEPVRNKKVKFGLKKMPYKLHWAIYNWSVYVYICSMGLLYFRLMGGGGEEDILLWNNGSPFIGWGMYGILDEISLFSVASLDFFLGLFDPDCSWKKMIRLLAKFW